MTGGRRRAPRPATTDEFEAGILRAAYIERFTSDPDVRAWLSERATPHRALPDQMRAAVRDAILALGPDLDPSLGEWLLGGREPHLALVADARQVLRRLGLDALDGLPRSDVLTGIVEWLVSDSPVAAFVTYAGSFGWTEAEVGDVEVGREQIGVSPSGRPIVGIDRRPLVRVDLEDEWDPSREPRGLARRRILDRLTALLDEELDRIERHARELGYRFPDTRPNVSRDLDWLVWRVRDGLTWEEIANRHAEAGGQPVGADTVRKAVGRLAKFIGVTLPPEI